MVVLAASIVTKGGKPLLSRQFLGLPRSRLESLLASFPRLVSPTSEHTVLEASGVRFVYTPLEDLYVLLITNTQSNILLDLSTLSLVTRIATELGSGGRGGAIGEMDVMRVSFEILSAWDEVISLGWRENVSLQQVRSILEMESHEEKIQEIIARNKEHEAKEELKRRAKQLELQRREMTRRGQNPYSTNSSSGFTSQNNSYTPSAPSYDAPAPQRSYGEDRAPASTAKPFKTKGMQLGAKGRKNDTGLAQALDGLDAEEPLLLQRQVEEPQQHYSSAPSPAPVAAPAANDVSPFEVPEQQESVHGGQIYVERTKELISNETIHVLSSVHLVVRESFTLELNRDGGVESLSLKGDLDLRISDPAKAVLVIALPPPSSYGKANDLQFKTHPNVDKNAWAQRGEIKLKEGKKGFPVGQGLGVLKWRMTGTDQSVIPISINCWPSSDNGVCTVNLEYELENTSISLHNVLISIALPPGSQPSLSEAPSNGSYSLNPETSRLDWVLDEVSVAAGTTNGSLEFEVDGDDIDAFFPVVVDFVSQKGLSGVEILSVTNPADQSQVDFSIDSLLAVDKYEVV
ncbi:BQ2448_6926 [Microbotryum intermedium]|uniref:Coatomer subunit delta n=1 Tax=Microbotryum intermedium TaxID=269621 RepID=A0A238FLG3_9BASI|nr:BQ2448_6926 [Microbotryum intermedium]